MNIPLPDRPRVLLTDRIDPAGEALLGETAELLLAPDNSAATLRALAAEVDGIVVRCKLPDDICEQGTRLRGLVRHGVGLDFIPVEAATRAGVAVANLPGSNTRAVVEYCLSAIMHLARPLARIDAALRSSGWDAARAPAYDVEEIGGRTLGILGMGAVGSRLAPLARDGLGMEVIATSRSTSLPDGVRSVGIDRLFAESDVVVICCALTPETLRIVNAARIGAMKPGAILVNAARGPVIDTPALMDALRRGRIGGAALDVYDVHPLAAGDPLLDLPNLLLTPHVAGITRTSIHTMGVEAAGQMLAILTGQDPSNLVNPDYRQYREGAGRPSRGGQPTP